MDLLDGFILSFLITANSLKPILLKKFISSSLNTSVDMDFKLALIKSCFLSIVSKLST